MPFATVAAIAATLLRPKMPDIIAISKAYFLLEYAAAAQRGLKNGLHCEQAMKAYSRDKFFMFQKSIEKKIQRKYAPDDLGGNRPLPVDFKKALTELMGKSKEVKMVDKETRFKHWLMYCLKKDLFEASNLIAEMKDKGIPWKLFEDSRDNMASWWEWEKSKITEENGRRGGKAKKRTRQARPPYRKLREIIEQQETTP